MSKEVFTDDGIRFKEMYTLYKEGIVYQSNRTLEGLFLNVLYKFSQESSIFVIGDNTPYPKYEIRDKTLDEVFRFSINKLRQAQLELRMGL